MSRVTYVFCHGLNGYGEANEGYRKRPYWGRRSGDVVAEWRRLGVDAHAADVAPQGSAWDRACELYAQIAGTRTDYGRAHSETYRHARYGRDFRGQALIPVWDEDTRLILIGHSFGGATIRLFAELLAHGSDQERQVTPAEELSPLFGGGLGSRVLAIVTLAAPTNGTTAYDLADDPGFDEGSVKVPLRHRLLDGMVKRRTAIQADGRDPRDWANFDMSVDHAQALNDRIQILPHVYYLSVACDATVAREDGTCVPDRRLMDPLFVRMGTLMGVYSTTTAGGCVVDDAWHANDGLVNTCSERAPFGAPCRRFDPGHIERGMYNVLDDLRADHSFFTGGYLHRQDPHPFFRDLLGTLETLG